AICANTVSEPCPISTVPVYIDRLASSLSFITAQETDGVIVALIIQARPFPLLTAASPCLPISLSLCLSLFSQPIDLATSFKHSLSPTVRNVFSVTNLSPSLYPFCLRSSSGSILSAAAMISICDSTPHADWETPKPRKAPAGGLFV